MAFIVTYGIGGWCENCTEEHSHPLNNIIQIVEVDETKDNV